MAIKLNWNTLTAVRSDLEETWNLKPDSKITFVLLLKDGSQHKKTIPFQQFLKFFWFIYDEPKFYVKGLVITDNTGKILYRHRQKTGDREEIPHGGNSHIFERWADMSDSERDVHLNILLSQINDYTESDRKFDSR